MEKIIFGSKMKKVDSYTMDIVGIPSMVLMERAAFSVFLYISRHIDKSKSFLCLCGMGNNGADGIALGRMLKLAGYNADVVTVGNEEKATEQWKSQKQIALSCNVNIEKAECICVTQNGSITYDKISEKLNAYDYVIDTMFGIGLTRNVEGIYADFISCVNNAHNERKDSNRVLKVYSLDVPSGLCADTGRIMGIAIQADKTFTFGAMKTGLLLYKGKDIAGESIVCDIGFPESAYENGLAKEDICTMPVPEDLKKIAVRKKHTNKGSYGKVLVIAGSENMFGAAYLAAGAAYETGAGLVRVITHENNRSLIYEKLPEAMINVYRTGQDEEDIINMTEEAVRWSDAVVIGPGLSKCREARLLLEYTMRFAKEHEKYIVIDADGLNIIADDAELKKHYHKKTVITPHMGEAARLTGKAISAIAENIIMEMGAYAKENNINIIQKDSTTVTFGIESGKDKCNNRVCINTSGNPGMATGGSGDVLAGMTAAMLAGGMNVGALCDEADGEIIEKTFLGAAMAVYLHGLAGDMAAEAYGEASMTATDILNMIHKVVNRKSVINKTCEYEESAGN